jgi:hypothetical protein
MRGQRRGSWYLRNHRGQARAGRRAAVPCGDGPVDLRLTGATKSSRTVAPPQPSRTPGRWWGGRSSGRSVASGGDDFRSGSHRCDQIIEDGGASATIAGARSLVWWSKAVILVAAQWRAAATTFDLVATGVGGIGIGTQAEMAAARMGKTGCG